MKTLIFHHNADLLESFQCLLAESPVDALAYEMIANLELFVSAIESSVEYDCIVVPSRGIIDFRASDEGIKLLYGYLMNYQERSEKILWSDYLWTSSPFDNNFKTLDTDMMIDHLHLLASKKAS